MIGSVLRPLSFPTVLGSRAGALMIAVSLAVALSAPAARGECVDYGGISHWVGDISLGSSDGAFDVAVSGDYAYVSTVVWAGGPAVLKIVNVSDPSAPFEVGETPVLGFRGGVDVSGDHAFVAMASMLHVVDVSVPASPAVVGSVDTPGPARDVVVSGTKALVADGTAFTVVDVTDPASPVVIGSVPISEDAHRVTVSGSLAYLSVNSFPSRELLVVDFTTTTAPAVVGSVPFSGYVGGVDVRDNWVYVAGPELRVVDASNPANPVVATTLPSAAGAEVVVVGQRAYIPSGWILDISNPGAPVVESPFYLGDGNATTDGKLLCTAGGSLRIATLGESTADSYVADLSVSGDARDVSLAGARAYVATENGVSVVDVSDPAAPALLGSAAIPGGGSDVVAAGDYAYLTNTAGLEIVDATAPASPVLEATLPLAQGPTGLAVDGSIVYVVVKWFGLYVVDVSSPAAPTVVGSFGSDLSELAAIAHLGDRIYLVDCCGGGIDVVDVSEPTAPIGLGTLDHGGAANAAVVSGDLLYVGTGRSLRIVDVADPGAPVELAMVTSQTTLQDLVLEGGLIYAAESYGSDGGMAVFDVMEPTESRFLGIVPADWARGIDASGSYVFVAGGSGTDQPLNVLRGQCESDAVGASLGTRAAGLVSYPNPFRLATRIPVDLRGAGRVDLSIHDVRGRRVWFASRIFPEGSTAEFRWHGRDQAGRRLPAGAYFYEARSGRERRSGKLILLK